MVKIDYEEQRNYKELQDLRNRIDTSLKFESFLSADSKDLWYDVSTSNIRPYILKQHRYFILFYPSTTKLITHPRGTNRTF